MGYRSDVKLVMTKKAYDGMVAMAENEFGLNSYEYDFIANNEDKKIAKDNDIVILSWNDVKWYNDFAEVQFIQEYLNVMYDANESYNFIRLGEEIDDIEKEGCYGDGSCAGIIGVYRNIEVYEEV